MDPRFMTTLEGDGSAQGREENNADDDRDRQIINQLNGSVPPLAAAATAASLRQSADPKRGDNMKKKPAEKLKVRIKAGKGEAKDPEGTSSGRSGSSSQEDNDDTLRDEDDDDDDNDDDDEEAAAMAAAAAAADALAVAQKKKRRKQRLLQQQQQQQQSLKRGREEEENVPSSPPAKMAMSNQAPRSSAQAAAADRPGPSSVNQTTGDAAGAPERQAAEKAMAVATSAAKKASAAQRQGRAGPLRPRLSAAAAAAQVELLSSQLARERKIVKGLQAVLDQYTQ
jgi:hypothetical protein